MNNSDIFIQKLRSSGLRPTRQRINICKLLFDRKNTFHFTINDLAQSLDDRYDNKISLATIYNTLKQFTNLGLIREIVVDQNKSLYCTNKESHYHLYIEDEDKVVDIPTKNVNLDIPQIPACLRLHNIDVIVRIRTLKESRKN